MIKLAIRMVSQLVPVQYENPGFQVGDILRWDEEVVPLLKQPRPIVGVVREMWHNGCVLIDGTDNPSCEPGVFFTFEYLARVSVVERDGA